MRTDRKLSFFETEQVECQYGSEFPNADNITRRLKKLVQIIGKNEYQTNLSFNSQETESEPTGLSLEEKNGIVSLLKRHGLTSTSANVSSEGKVDF